MNEVYLFINPLEQSFIQLAPYFAYFRHIYHESSRLQVVPLVNLQVIRDLQQTFQSQHPSLERLFRQDQQLACEMKVKNVDTSTWFNYQYDQKYGYLIEGLENIKNLPKFIQPEKSGKMTFLDLRAYK